MKAKLTIRWYCCEHFGHSLVSNSFQDWAPERVPAHHLVVGSLSLPILFSGRFEVILALGDLHLMVGAALPEKVRSNG